MFFESYPSLFRLMIQVLVLSLIHPPLSECQQPFKLIDNSNTLVMSDEILNSNLNVPLLNSSNTKFYTLIDDYSRQIVIAIQEKWTLPIVDIIIDDNSLVFLCDQYHIYITTLKPKFYNPYLIDDQLRIIYQANYMLTGLALDPIKRRLYFSTMHSQIGYLELTPPDIRFCKMLEIEKKYQINHLLFDVFQRKLVWTDYDDLIQSDLDGNILNKVKLNFTLKKAAMDVNNGSLFIAYQGKLLKYSFNDSSMNILINNMANFTTTRSLKIIGDFLAYFISEKEQKLYRVIFEHQNYLEFEMLSQLNDRTNYFMKIFTIQTKNPMDQPEDHTGNIWDELINLKWINSDNLPLILGTIFCVTFINITIFTILFISKCILTFYLFNRREMSSEKK